MIDFQAPKTSRQPEKRAEIIRIINIAHYCQKSAFNFLSQKLLLDGMRNTLFAYS